MTEDVQLGARQQAEKQMDQGRIKNYRYLVMTALCHCLHELGLEGQGRPVKGSMSLIGDLKMKKNELDWDCTLQKRGDGDL